LVNIRLQFAIEEHVNAHVDWLGPVPRFYSVPSLAKRQVFQFRHLLVR
jgi:hypothetical protein